MGTPHQAYPIWPLTGISRAPERRGAEKSASMVSCTVICARHEHIYLIRLSPAQADPVYVLSRASYCES